jgi:NAD(P)-dependent dehydrogenase (short-subunit alcohol dehydrogenase family)
MTPRGILITGTSSGIGLETAVHLAERGFRVYATMRDLGRREELETEAARRNAHLDVLQLDVTDQSSIEVVVGTLVDQGKSIYGLVNNAGIVIRGYFEDVSDAEMRQVFETNVFGTMAVTRAVLPHMRAAGQGRVVIMSSSVGRIAAPASSAYCASKFALEGFGESLALEVAPLGLEVSLIEPGFVKTELFGRNRRIAERALDPQGPYHEWFEKLQSAGEEEVRASPISAADVARTVHKALTVKRPKLRYVIRFRAKLLLTLRRYLPGELFEQVWLRAMSRRIGHTGRAVEEVK